MQGKKRSILCPACKAGKLIRVADDSAALHIRTHPPPLHHRAQYFIKCSTCKAQIGISQKYEKI